MKKAIKIVLVVGTMATLLGASLSLAADRTRNRTRLRDTTCTQQRLRTQDQDRLQLRDKTSSQQTFGTQDRDRDRLRDGSGNR
jgi:hypothetical protein